MDFFQISKGGFSSIFPADFDDIKTVNGHDSDPQTVLISSKSVGKIGGKSRFEFRKKTQLIMTAG